MPFKMRLTINLRSLLLVTLLGVVNSCTYQAAIILDVGSNLDATVAREVYLTVEAALARVGFARENLMATSGSEAILRRDDDKYAISYFSDPKSPAALPDAWHVKVVLEKRSNFVEVIFVQPGAREPSKELAARSDDVLLQLRQLMPAVPINKNVTGAAW